MSGRGTPMNANHRRPAADEDEQEALSKQPPVTLSHSSTHTLQVGQCAALTSNDYISVYLYFEVSNWTDVLASTQGTKV
jgi:hypothetical protein